MRHRSGGPQTNTVRPGQVFTSDSGYFHDCNHLLKASSNSVVSKAFCMTVLDWRGAFSCRFDCSENRLWRFRPQEHFSRIGSDTGQLGVSGVEFAGSAVMVACGWSLSGFGIQNPRKSRDLTHRRSKSTQRSFKGQ